MNWSFFWWWKYDSKNWTFFWIRVKELKTPFLIWLKELNLFLELLLNMTQRIELFFFFKMTHMTRGINFFSIFIKELSPFLKNITQVVDLFQNDSKNWTLFRQYDSKNCPFFQYDSKNWTLFNQYDSKNCLLFSIWFKELNSLNMTQRIELFYVSKEFNLPFHTTQRIQPSLF